MENICLAKGWEYRGNHYEKQTLDPRGVWLRREGAFKAICELSVF